MGTAWPLEDGGYLLAGNSIDSNDIVADTGAAGYGGMAGRSSVYLTQVDADHAAPGSGGSNVQQMTDNEFEDMDPA